MIHSFVQMISSLRSSSLFHNQAALSSGALWQKCGVSWDTTSHTEGGETIPGVHVLARLAWGVGKTITDFFGGIEDE